jgi:hypothetical protein
MVGRTSQERTGYETQKPEKLMERIITSCSSEDDLCGDFFAGSGSFGAVCERLGRRWVMCDQGSLAISSEIARMSHEIGDSGFIVERKGNREQVGASVTCSVQKNSNGVKTIRCTDYHIDRGLVRCNNQEEVQRFLDGDSLSLIKFWSIGQRQVGSTKQEFYREISRTYDGHDELEIPQEEGEILVVGYDLFGNRFSAGVVI